MNNETCPALSILVITRNRARLLRRCLDSLLKEIEAECLDTEVIVVDGASSDGTVELLEGYGARISSWLSEPDNSVGEAVNKGLKMAAGRIIRLLGDDDEVIPGGLAKMMRYLDEHPEIDGVAGHNQVLIEDNEGRAVTYSQRKFEGDVSLDDVRAFPHRGIFVPECLFCRREVYDQCGGFDESFRYWGYLDHYFRIVKSGFRIRVIPEEILTTYQTPQSDSIRANGSPRWIEEWRTVQKRHNTFYWRMFHELGGDISFKRLVSYSCSKLTGKSPRRLLRGIRHVK